MHKTPHTSCTFFCTGSGEVALEQFQSAVLELQRGLSISQLAALEHALCQHFGVGSFGRLGQGPTLLQAVAARPDLQAALGDGAGCWAERNKVTSFATLPSSSLRLMARVALPQFHCRSAGQQPSAVQAAAELCYSHTLCASSSQT